MTGNTTARLEGLSSMGQFPASAFLEHAEADDAEESVDFVKALINGQVAGTEKVIEAVDRRFNSRARRDREFRAYVRQRFDAIDQALAPLRYARVIVGAFVLIVTSGAIGGIVSAIALAKELLT